MTTETDTTAQTSPAGTVTGQYQIDPAHSRLGFVARHAMVTKVRGKFNDFSGSLYLDEADPSRSTAEVTVQMGTVETGQPQRDEHLRTSDFFEVEKYPTMTFKSTKAERNGQDNYRLTGDLTIKGVSRPVTLDIEYNGLVRDPFGNDRAGFEARTVINRKDWGLTWNAALEAGGVMVSDKITLELDIAAVRTPTEA
ncbi:MAG TPA: YceI family protein [Acidimicrobiales bacterium]|nr:YceI family protein [Acidimicrobiales bacterium]